MKCDPTTKRYTIAVPEDNSFTLILPLKQRTYVSNVPIDTPIVYAELEDVELTVGGEEYATTQELDGVHVEFADGLKRGIYDIILTATYRGAQIRAAYFEALKAVQWQYLSSFEQYTVGSPVVADAAFVIGGPLTDAELEALKAEYREAIAEAEQAKADAEAEKEHYAEAVEQLDDLATKQDIAGLAEKSDLADLATKQDIAGLAEKTDLADLATKQDIAGLAEKTDLEGLATAQNVTDAKNEILAALPQEASAEFIQSLFASES